MSEFRYQYDRNRREYIEEGHMELGPTYVAPVKKLLSDVGTRLDHINDLIDYLDEGLIAVTHSLERYANENDLSRKKRLESSLTFVGIYRDQLANVVGQKWNFNKVLDDCVPELDVQI